MMAQYRRIKAELPKDALLLFRLGDFYEMFFDDAVEGARILNLALTRRQAIPMCGLPHHAANGYIARLLRAGRKVAICDQLEDAKPGKLVKRDVTQILSPGTHFDERMLTAERNNFLAAVHAVGSMFGIACVDLTTGDFKTTELGSEAELLTELERLRPTEVIHPGEAASLRALLQHASRILVGHDDWTFAPETAVFTVREHFKVASLDGFGLKDRVAATGAAGAVLHYLTQQLRRDVKHLTRLSFYQCRDFLVLDATTLRNLEILEPLHRDAPRNTSLFGALNRTVTPMGARRLRDWLTQPLAAVEPIHRRQDAVQSWLDHTAALDAFRAKLAAVRDLERTISRLSVGTGNARDLIALRMALEQLPGLRETLASVGGPGSTPAVIEEGGAQAEPRPPSPVAGLASQVTEMPALVELIGRAIMEDAPLALKEGGIIRDGFDAALDELRTAMRGGKDWIAKLQQDEITRTGIASLKVRFNSVFGYYIEVTKSNLDKVPADYVRKQTVANGERFFTPALKEMESRILGAEERATKLEYDLFLKVREQVLGCLRAIQQTAGALAQLDALAGFAESARHFNYCRPEVGDEGRIVIRDGRHPVLDQALVEERFVPNDTLLGSSGRQSAPVEANESQSRLTSAATESPQIALITGPNMAGKSTYIRQVALLALLAHTGSFIPAASARVDLVDRIFTRIGASDDLARGQSTFMVEMSETANILNNATPRSLIILDEIGRGTSTFDGLSLAWSIVEHLHNAVGAKSLFATHYHELTELAGKLGRVRNFNVAVREWRDSIVFLRKIVAGGTDKSYGIQVARLAGVPREVIERAKVILGNLEESELTPEGDVRPSRREQDRARLKSIAPSPQMDLFS
ncbi:MAG: DNA mismatch repair protein MutS [Verrucomicrobia bacterium]|nr:DNA mismatch repair protein MutS [Verrucomicrobiota bacterium]